MAGKRRRSESDHSDSDSHSESSEDEEKFRPRNNTKKGRPSIVVESDEENDSDRESGEDSPHSDDVGGVEDLTVRLESIENGIGLKADKEALRRLKKRVEKLEAYVEEIKVKGAPDRRTDRMSTQPRRTAEPTGLAREASNRKKKEQRRDVPDKSRSSSKGRAKKAGKSKMKSNHEDSDSSLEIVVSDEEHEHQELSFSGERACLPRWISEHGATKGSTMVVHMCIRMAQYNLANEENDQDDKVRVDCRYLLKQGFSHGEVEKVLRKEFGKARGHWRVGRYSQNYLTCFLETPSLKIFYQIVFGNTCNL